MRKRSLVSLMALVSSLSLAAAVPAYAAPQLNRAVYVATGDSYSSGALLGGDAQNCDRSPAAYPVVLAGGAKRVNFTACSGDTIAAMTSKLPTSPQPQVKIVTLTLGGDDTHWQGLVKACLTTGCGQDDLDAFLAQVGAVGPAAVAAIAALHEAYPKATIYWGGYVTPFGSSFVLPAPPFGNVCQFPLAGITATINPSTAGKMNDALAYLNTTLQGAIAQAQSQGLPVEYVDADPAFAGHRYCDSGESWLFNLHPTVEGQQAYAEAFATAGVGK